MTDKPQDERACESALNDLLSFDHPYYCSESNYFSNDAGSTWETMSDFLDEFEDADINMNLVFRWDVKSRGEGKSIAERYYAEVFLMAQRRGIFMPNIINHINEAEAVRFRNYLEKHWKTLLEIWKPISGR